jgi:hypothetical protein
LRAHISPAIGELQNKVDFAGTEIRVDLVGDRTDQFKGEKDVGKFDPVRQLNGHHIAGPNSLGL